VTGVTVLAVLRDGNPVVSPSGDLALAAGDHLLALGTGEQLKRLDKLVTAGIS
jgi:K+/H+ antiporter YhaU regulatory subunit KhtT